MQTETAAPIEVDPDKMNPQEFRAWRLDPLAKPAAAPKEKEPSAAADVEEDEDAKTEATPETATEQDVEDSEKPKKKGGFQKRIDTLTRDKTTLATENEELKRRLAALPAAAKPADVPKPSQEGKPVAANFETYEAFVEALTDWKLEANQKLQVKAKADNDQATERQTAAQKWTERVETLREEKDDYDEVIKKADHIKVSAAMHEVLLHSEQGPAIAYFLASNLKEAERIAKLSPLAAAAALGRIEAQLSPAASEDEPEPKSKVSSAPAPIRPVSSKSATTTKKIDDMSQAEFRAARESGKLH